MLKEDIVNHKQFIKLWRKLRNRGVVLRAPTQTDVSNVSLILQADGNLTSDYISKILMAHAFAISHSHTATGIRLYDNLIAGKKIFINSYLPYISQNEKTTGYQAEAENEDLLISEEGAVFRDLYGDDEDYINDQMEGEGSF